MSDFLYTVHRTRNVDTNFGANIVPAKTQSRVDTDKELRRVVESTQRIPKRPWGWSYAKYHSNTLFSEMTDLGLWKREVRTQVVKEKPKQWQPRRRKGRYKKVRR